MQRLLGPMESRGRRFVNLRTRRSCTTWFAFVELQVPADWSVARAHELAGAAEGAVIGKGVTLTFPAENTRTGCA